MIHLYSTIPFIVIATLIIIALAKSDERRKKQHQKAHGENYGVAFQPKTRQRLAWCLILPAIVLALEFNVSGVLIYFGAVSVIGWALSAMPTRWV